MNRNEAIKAWNEVKDVYAANGLILPGGKWLFPGEWNNSAPAARKVDTD